MSQIDRERGYSPLEAVRLVKELEGAKFDETVEAHFRLGLNVRHADQQLRGTIMLPHGIGKDVRVAVFAEGEKAKGWEPAPMSSARPTSPRRSRQLRDFDVAIATPDDGHGRQARPYLGPRGKMRTPDGTVTLTSPRR
jgi:large subunit ribosomal protein L1